MRNPAVRLAALLLTLLPGAAAAQGLPTGPVSAFDGQLALGAEVVATVGERDDDAFFNYTDYEHNVLRMFRVALSAAWRPIEPIALVAEVRSEDLDHVRGYAAYVRVRPWRSRPLDFQAGRIPPVFGSFGRRGYGAEHLLVGYPLAYQYLTSLRPDAIPATYDDLLRMRGRGWRTSFPIGAAEPATGLPLVSAFRWDTGVQARWRPRRLDLAAALTAGTLADPRVSDNNSGKQISARAAATPLPGLVLGISGARGAWLDRDVMALLPSGSPEYEQSAVGADVEYSRNYWLVRGEFVWSRWRMPFAALASATDLDARAWWIEGRYRFSPRIFAAARFDRLVFSEIPTDEGGRLSWDAPVWRIEGNMGYYLRRNLVARLAVQHNDRDGGRVHRRTYVSGQLAYWF